MKATIFILTLTVCFLDTINAQVCASKPCNVNHPNFQMCLEGDGYGAPFACLCKSPTGDPFLTTSADCDPSVTLTSTMPTTPRPGPGGSQCMNGGVFAYNICHCPSGFYGTNCSIFLPQGLCDGVNCLNKGVCAVTNTNGPYQAVCRCLTGTWGDFCEMNGTMGFCSANFCSNGGACKENVGSSTRYAYCQCPAGYNGVKCEKPYFTCTRNGSFTDTELFEQGRYIQCTGVNGVFRGQYKWCPKGLRFNAIVQLCTR